MRICLLTNDREFLLHAPIVLQIKGLRRVHAELDAAMAKPEPPNLILGQLAAPKFIDYLDRREHDRRLSRIPLVVFTDRCAPPDREQIDALGAAAVLELDEDDQAEITGRLTHVLRSGATARPLPMEPFAHQSINLETLGLAKCLTDLPGLDAFCRASGRALPTPIIALSDQTPPALLGTFETEEDAARARPSVLIDLTAQPEASLLHMPERGGERSRSDLAAFIAAHQESATVT